MEEEIARIQAHREMGARSPPDLQYLYNKRPRSPATTVVFPPGFANSNQPPQPFIAPAVPILANPTPRTPSLPCGAAPVDQSPNTQQKPILPTLQMTSPTLNAPSNSIKIASALTVVSTPTSLVFGAGVTKQAPLKTQKEAWKEAI